MILTVLFPPAQLPQVLVVTEWAAFAAFGIVQALEGAFTYRTWIYGPKTFSGSVKRNLFGNIAVEVYYIFLSLFAKFFIGVMLFVNVYPIQN